MDRAVLVACIAELQQFIALLDELKRTRLPADFDGEAYVSALLDKVKDDALEGYPSKDGRILELYVQPAHRGRKVGARLMQAMEQYFRDHGCVGCLVDCFAPNTDAHEFYTSLGYVDRLTTLLKIL